MSEGNTINSVQWHHLCVCNDTRRTNRFYRVHICINILGSLRNFLDFPIVPEKLTPTQKSFGKIVLSVLSIKDREKVETIHFSTRFLLLIVWIRLSISWSFNQYRSKSIDMKHLLITLFCSHYWGQQTVNNKKHPTTKVAYPRKRTQGRIFCY